MRIYKLVGVFFFSGALLNGRQWNYILIETILGAEGGFLRVEVNGVTGHLCNDTTRAQTRSATVSVTARDSISMTNVLSGVSHHHNKEQKER